MGADTVISVTLIKQSLKYDGSQVGAFILYLKTTFCSVDDRLVLKS